MDNDPLGTGVLGHKLSGTGADGQNLALKHAGEIPNVLREFIIADIVCIDTDSKAGIFALLGAVVVAVNLVRVPVVAWLLPLVGSPP